MRRIVLTDRYHDIHACIGGWPEMWACGATACEAIGKLVMAHPEIFLVAPLGPNDPTIATKIAEETRSKLRNQLQDDRRRCGDCDGIGRIHEGGYGLRDCHCQRR